MTPEKIIAVIEMLISYAKASRNTRGIHKDSEKPGAT